MSYIDCTSLYGYNETAQDELSWPRSRCEINKKGILVNLLHIDLKGKGEKNDEVNIGNIDSKQKKIYRKTKIGHYMPYWPIEEQVVGIPSQYTHPDQIIIIFGQYTHPDQIIIFFGQDRHPDPFSYFDLIKLGASRHDRRI